MAADPPSRPPTRPRSSHCLTSTTPLDLPGLPLQVRGTKVVYRADPNVMLEVNNGTNFGDRGVKVQLSNVASGRPNQV